MSVEKASTFLNEWVTQNVHADVYPDDDTEAKRLAKRCLEAAEEEGISKAQLEEAAGEDLVNCMIDAQVAATEAKIDDLVEKDD